MFLDEGAVTVKTLREENPVARGCECLTITRGFVGVRRDKTIGFTVRLEIIKRVGSELATTGAGHVRGQPLRKQSQTWRPMCQGQGVHSQGSWWMLSLGKSSFYLCHNLGQSTGLNGLHG